MLEISGTNYECELVARLLFGRRAAPVRVALAPGDYTLYDLLIVPVRHVHNLSTQKESRGPRGLWVTCLGQGYTVYIHEAEEYHYPRIFNSVLHCGESSAELLATFFRRVYAADVSDAPKLSVVWSPGDATKGE